MWIISRLEYDFLFCLSGGGEEVVRDLTFRLRPMSCNMQVNDPHQSGGLVINIVCCSVWDVVTRQADWLCHAVTGGLTSLSPSDTAELCPSEWLAPTTRRS